MPSVTTVWAESGGFYCENFRVAAIAVLHRVYVQVPNFTGKGFVLIAVNVLLAKHQNLPVQPSAIDFAELLVTQRLA